VISVAYYLFLPFGVIASRSFQPDPLMVAFVALSLLGLHHWNNSPDWQRTLIAGALCGIAILIKLVAIFPVIGALVGLTLFTYGTRGTFTNKKFWVIIVLATLPALIYNLLIIPERSSGLFKFWVLSFNRLLIDLSFYIHWGSLIQNLFGFIILVMALWGVLLLRPGAERGMMLGVWVGYFFYGLSLPYQVMTHNYYHLMLIPILGLSFATSMAAVFHRLADQSTFWRVAAFGVLFLAILAQMWDVREDLARRDYRNEPASWQELREIFPWDGKAIALTQAYGYRLKYYAMIDASLWLSKADIDLLELGGKGVFEYEEEFAKRTEGMDYFLITDFKEFDKQSELKAILFDNYQVYREGDGYLIFDLR